MLRTVKNIHLNTEIIVLRILIVVNVKCIFLPLLLYHENTVRLMKRNPPRRCLMKDGGDSNWW